MFGVDICCSLFTGFVKGANSMGSPSGILVTDRATIARNYLGGWFILDLLSTIPWGVLAGAFTGGGGGGAASMGRSARLVKLFRFLRLMRLARLAKLWAFWESVEAKVGSTYMRLALNLASQVFRLALICHWNACIWWMIGDPDSIFGVGHVDHWIQKVPSSGGPPMTNRSTIERYVFSFYWTLGVMRTMPAEISPTNLIERIYLMFFMFIAFSLFAICIAQITSTVFKFSARVKTHEEDQSNVRAYMRSIGLDKRVQDAVNNWFKTQFDHGRNGLPNAGKWVNDLPEPLKLQIRFSRQKLFLLNADVLRELPADLPPTLLDKALYYMCNACSVRFHPVGAVLSVAGRIAEDAHIRMSGCLKAKRSRPSEKRESYFSVNDMGSRGTVDVVDLECLRMDDALVLSEFTVVVTYCAEVITLPKEKYSEILSGHEDFLTGSESEYEQRPKRATGPRSSADHSAYDDEMTTAVAAIISA